MTRSKIFWTVLLVWSVVIALLIVWMVTFYVQDMADRTPAELAEARAYERQYGGDPNESGIGCWFIAFVFLWLVVALPLFIAAIATKREKPSFKEKQNGISQLEK